jgi:RNA polymerase sigma factor for flagellar operon FliA
MPATNKYRYQRDADSQTSSPAWNDMTPAERSDVMERYSPLIKYVADRLASRLPAHISRDDLIGSGALGLIDAIDKYDAQRNIQFKTYAEIRIKGAMLDELRSLDWVPRSVRKKALQIEKAYQNLENRHGRPPSDEETAAELGWSLAEYHRQLNEARGVSIIDLEAFRPSGAGGAKNDLFEILADDSGVDALAALGLSEARDVVAGAIDRLPEKERLVVTLYYYEELTMKEIGSVLNYTESRISQLHTKALLRLKSKLRTYFEEKGA